MRKQRRLIFLLLGMNLFFLLGSALLHFQIISFPTERKNTDTIICAIPPDEVIQITWSGGLSSFSLQKDAAGTWTAVEKSDIPLDQSRVRGDLTALCQIVSSRRIDDAEPGYGLSPAQRECTITLSDGRSVLYRLGCRNTYTNRYYFQLGSESTVFTVGYSVGEAMSRVLEEYMSN